MDKKKSTNVLLIVLEIMIIIEIVARVLIIQKDTITGIVQLLSLAFTALYGFWLYKKPHGNVLKYAIFIFVFATILSGSYFLLKGHTYQIAKIFASAALCYCAGRLHRIDQNRYIMPVIGLLYLGVSICAARQSFVNNTATVLSIFKVFNFTINYFTLMIAYFVRYDEHKEAGLIDAPKN